MLQPRVNSGQEDGMLQKFQKGINEMDDVRQVDVAIAVGYAIIEIRSQQMLLKY